MPMTIEEAQTFELKNFVEAYRKEVKAFQGHSFQSCVEHIIERGKAEIKRQVETARKTTEKNAITSLLKMHNVTTVQEAQALLAKLQSQTAKS